MIPSSQGASDAPVHATLIAGWRGGRWRGVLLRAPSGAGKSALALRAMASGWALVADDRVRLWKSDCGLYGAAPRPLAGLVEARGQGVLRRSVLRFAPVVLLIESGAGERIPPPRTEVVAGVRLPCAWFEFGEVGAVVRLDLALDAALAPSTVL